MTNEAGAARLPMVTRALCASLSRMEGSVMDQMLALRNQLTAPHAELGLCMAALYTSRWFLLWFEGPADVVDRAVRRAGSDKRNAHQQLVHRSVGPATLLEPVTVVTTQAPVQPTQFARHLAHIKVRTDLDPRQIWRWLGAPCVLGHGRRWQEPLARQVAIVSAEPSAPVEQLRKIGAPFSSPVVHQRFATSRVNTGDVGVAYVDLPLHEGIGRIRLLSRRALRHAMLRFSLTGIDALVLMLGSNPEPAMELATSAGETIATLRHPPELLLADARDGAVGSACAQLVRHSGVSRVSYEPGATDLESLLSRVGMQPSRPAASVRAA